MNRFTILASMLIGAVLFITLIVFVNQDHQDAQEEKRKENIRVARLANGLSEKEIDANSAKLPKVVVPETDYEFGYLSEGDSFKHIFEIRNDGDATLELTAVRPSCDCIKANLMRRAVEPGEKTQLELYFKPDGKVGDVTQGVRVGTNDPQRKEIAFRIIGRTKQVYWVDRKDITFTDLQPDESRDQELYVFSSHADGFDLLDLQAQPASITAKIEPADLENLPEAVKEDAKDAKSGKKIIVSCPRDLRDFSGAKISFSVKHGEEAKSQPYDFNVSGTRLGRIGVYGNPLDSLGRMKFGKLPLGEGKKAIYAVKVRGEERDLKIKSVVTQPTGVLVSMEPVDADHAKNGQYRLIVEIPAAFPEQSHMGKYAGKIDIEFENPLHKKMEFKLEFAVVSEKEIQ